jgi:hypothetical protein
MIDNLPTCLNSLTKVFIRSQPQAASEAIFVFNRITEHYPDSVAMVDNPPDYINAVVKLFPRLSGTSASNAADMLIRIIYYNPNRAVTIASSPGCIAHLTDSLLEESRNSLRLFDSIFKHHPANITIAALPDCLNRLVNLLTSKNPATVKKTLKTLNWILNQRQANIRMIVTLSACLNSVVKLLANQEMAFEAAFVLGRIINIYPDKITTIVHFPDCLARLANLLAEPNAFAAITAVFALSVIVERYPPSIATIVNLPNSINNLVRLSASTNRSAAENARNQYLIPRSFCLCDIR